jgi:oligogalacturonide transporter
MVWSTLGAMVCGIVPTFMIKDNLDPASYLRCALLFGVLFFITSITVFFGTWEKQKEPVRSTMKESFPQAVSVFKSRSFRLFLGLYLFGQCGMDFISGMAVYYVDDVLNAYQNGYFTYIMAALMISQLLGMAVFGPIMSHTSKKMAIMIGAPIRLIGIAGLYLFSHEGANFTVILILSFIIGLGMAGSSTTIYAILADMADVDRLITSLNRPGICAAMATFIRKIATGVSSAVIGLLLAWVGYSETLASAGQRQTFHTQQGIALIYIFAPVVLMVLAIGFTVLCPMQKKEFEIVKTEIARRLGEDSSSPTPEEISTCEKITGFRYEELWNEKNALSL